MSEPVNQWTPTLGTQTLESQLENALRRSLGSIGYEISLDRARMNTIKDSAAGALEDTFLRSGPLFARLGMSLSAVGTLSTGSNLSLKDMAGDIMYEFYTESTTAFLLGLTELAAEAETWLRAQGVADDRIRSVLDAAEKSYTLPDKERFSREALPFIHERISMIGCMVLGGLTGLALGIVLTRAPHVGVIGALIGGGVGWYLSKKRRCTKSLWLASHLPRVLAQSLFAQWKANLRRYAEIVNTTR